MMGNLNFPVVSLGEHTGVIVNLVSAAGKVAIPKMESGGEPKFVRVVAMGGTDTNVISVSPTNDTNGVYANCLPLPATSSEGVILNVHGYSHIGYEDDGGVGDSALYIYPLEDF